MPRGGSRPGSGRKKSTTTPVESRPAKVAASEAPAAALGDKTPLDYMLSVMNDPRADERLRAQMAVAAAPYMHAKVGEGGKKDVKLDAAKKAASGKFKPVIAPPLKLVAQR